MGPRHQIYVFIFALLIFSSPVNAGSGWDAVCAIGASVAAVAAAPVVIAGMGFGATGIAAGSIASTMMSYSAIASGGGVVAGGVVATLQSAGVVGLGVGSKVVIGSVAGGATYAVRNDED